MKKQQLLCHEETSNRDSELRDTRRATATEP